jgi:hypothetical protein
MRKLIIIVIYLFLCISIYAQQPYTINDYGTYIIDNNSGLIKKLSIDQDLFLYKFWRKYAVFFILGRLEIVIININNGAISEALYEPYHYHPKILEDAPFLVIFSYGHIYKFDPINLELKEKTYVGEADEYLNTDSPKSETVLREKIGERTIRYKGKDSYIEITYGLKINMNYPLVSYNSILNRFAICVVRESYE